MPYTNEDVVEMIADGRLVISDLASRRLSKTQVVIELNNKQRAGVLTIPDGYRADGLLDTILHFFTLNHYVVRWGITQKTGCNAAVQSLFSFLESNLPKSDTHSGQDFSNASIRPRDLVDWIKHLCATDTPHNAWKRASYVRKLLHTALEKRFGRVSQWPRDENESWQAIRDHCPKPVLKIKRSPLGPFLGIATNQFSNRELFMGLRYGALWLLQRLQVIRERFLADPVIKGELSRLAGQTHSEFHESFSYYLHWLPVHGCVSPSKGQRFEAISPAVWRVINEEPLLREWQCYTWKGLRGLLISEPHSIAQPLSEVQQRMLISRTFHEDGTTRVHLSGKRTGRTPDATWTSLRPHLGLASSVNVNQPCVWGPDWWLHTPLERLLMVWLLATERAQKSGISRLTLDGVRLSDNENSLQISTCKLRRASHGSIHRPGRTDVESAIYKRRSPPFSVYLRWRNVEKFAQTQLREFNTENYFGQFGEDQLSGRVSQNTLTGVASSRLPLELLSVHGTIWQKEFLQETEPTARREAEAFIKILQNRIALKRANSKNQVSIPIEAIGQSLVVEQTLVKNGNRGYLDPVSAEVAGHSAQTESQYKDGFAALGVSEIVEPIRAFSRKVGDAKMAMAENLLTQLLGHSRLISLSEVESLCGIASTQSQASELLAKLDEAGKLTIAGEISHDGEMLIVETDLTAAMIWGYMHHIEGQLCELMLSERNDTSIRWIARLTYLHQVYARFSGKLQAMGKKLATELAFPFPPLA